MKNSLPSSNVS
jgi:hypothetical protein